MVLCSPLRLNPRCTPASFPCTSSGAFVGNYGRRCQWLPEHPFPFLLSKPFLNLFRMAKRSGWETNFPVSLANKCGHMPKVCPLSYRWKIIRVELQGEKKSLKRRLTQLIRVLSSLLFPPPRGLKHEFDG